MDDRQQKLLTMSDGRQVYIEETPLIKMEVHNDDAHVVSEQIIDIDEKQRKEVLRKITTNEICYDENSNELSFTPKKAE